MSSLPKTIYIIRHCDKNPLLGDDENLESSDNGCSDDGYQRALLLAGLNGSCEKNFALCNNNCSGSFNSSLPGFFPKLLGPDIKPILLAPLSKSNPDASKADVKCASSDRCCLLLNPLAYYYKTQINPNGEIFCDNEPDMVGKMLISNPTKYGNQTIILAYEHKAIPDLLNAMGLNPPLEPWPKKAGDRYDLVFKITFASDGKPQLDIFSEKLLPKDSDDIPFKETLITKAEPKIKKSKLWFTLSLVFFSILVIIFIFISYFLFFRKDNLVES